jgi:hypothetical protein
MQAGRRRNLLWGFTLIGVAVIVLLGALDALPEGLHDVLSRAWPALLVLAGLSILLPGRVPMGGILTPVLCILLVAGVAVVAYSTRAGQQRSDQQQLITQILSEQVNLLAVNISLLTSDIDLVRGTGDTARISGEFTGSMGSAITIDYTEHDGGIAEFTLREDRAEQIPRLDEIGRGALRLELPADVAVVVAFSGEQGSATFNMSDLRLERLNLNLRQGDAVVTLPAYQPLSPTAIEEPGDLTVANGSITIFVPATVSARLELDRGGNDIRPQFDPTYILIDDGADGTLEKRVTGEDDIPLYYEVTAPRGLIRLEVSPEG